MVASDAHLLLTLQTVLLVVINYGVLALPLVEVIDLLPRVRRVFERALVHCGLRARADSADEVRGPDPSAHHPRGSAVAHVVELSPACRTGVALPLCVLPRLPSLRWDAKRSLRRNAAVRVPRQADTAAPDAIELSSAALPTRARPANLAASAPGRGLATGLTSCHICPEPGLAPCNGAWTDTDEVDTTSIRFGDRLEGCAPTQPCTHR